MPMMIASMIGSFLIKLIMGLVGNPAFLQKIFFMVAEKLAALTPTDIDDKIILAAEQALLMKPVPEEKKAE